MRPLGGKIGADYTQRACKCDMGNGRPREKQLERRTIGDELVAAEAMKSGLGGIVVLDKEEVDEFRRLMANPPPPTKALIDLMRKKQP